MKTTWKTFEDTTRRGQNRSIKSQLVKDYYYYYYYYYYYAVGVLHPHAVWVYVYGSFLICVSRPCLQIFSKNVTELVDTSTPYIPNSYSP